MVELYIDIKCEKDPVAGHSSFDSRVDVAKQTA